MFKHLSVSNVATAKCAVGLLGKVGNKGAIGVRFALLATSFCFVGVHMAAGEDDDAREKRVKSFKLFFL